MMNWVDLPVPVTYSRADEYLAWVKANCATYITIDAVHRDGEFYYRFYFGDSEQGERDRIMFTLTFIPQDCASIREFTRRIDRGGMYNQPGLWQQRFRAAGYYSAEVNLKGPWVDMHEWCQDQFGEDHYAWTGSTFWFETEQAAVLFSLRWS